MRLALTFLKRSTSISRTLELKRKAIKSAQSTYLRIPKATALTSQKGGSASITLDQSKAKS
jgi:hypothetical protein